MSRKRAVRSGPPKKRRPKLPAAPKSVPDEQLERDQLLAEIETLRAAQIEIEHSQQIYAELFDLSPVPYINLSQSGDLLSANHAATALLAAPHTITRGIPFRTFVNIRDQPKFYNHLMRCKGAGAGDVNTELRLVPRGREPRVVELISRPSTMFGTNRIVYRTVIFDITARRQAEAALHQSESEFRQAVLLAPIAVMMQAEDGEIIELSESWSTLTGYSRRQTPTFASWLSHVSRPEAQRLRRAVEKAFATGNPTGDLEFEFVVSNGDHRNWIFNAARVGVLRDGRNFLVGMAVDITDRKRAEAALAASREQLHLIFENAREYAIFSMDLERRITSWNIGAQRLLGYAEAEVLGLSGDIIFTAEDRDEGVPVEEALRAARDGRALDERWHVRKDGSRFWGSGVMMPMQAADQTIGLLKIFRDYTEKREAEEILKRKHEELMQALRDAESARAAAEAAGKAKDQFLAVLSHELRSPLTPVLMSANMLLRRPDLPDDAREALEIIRRNVQIEVAIVDDLLDVTRINRGKLELRRVPTDLHEVVRHALEIARPDIDGKQQQLDVLLKAKASRVEGDPRRLQQVVWNLLKNASKFTPEHGKISLGTRSRGRDLWLEVSDNGIGIEPEALSRIFDAFAQANINITREFGGLGLGLAISKAVVDAHGGELVARSPGRGKGATFTVRLPAQG